MGLTQKFINVTEQFLDVPTRQWRFSQCSVVALQLSFVYRSGANWVERHARHGLPPVSFFGYAGSPCVMYKYAYFSV
jgi:hypothetical protein